MKMFKRIQQLEDEEDSVEIIDKLLASVKKEVKQIMEEAVTKKFIHEDSSSVISLCGSVDACLRFKLKKQTVGIFGNASGTTALLHKLGKHLEAAKEITKELDRQAEPFSRFSFKNLTSDALLGTSNGKTTAATPNKPNGYCKYTWIRLALFNKVLATIVNYLVVNSSKYYERTALLCDQSKGSLLANLLEGPCALEYTRLKTTDHLYTDPHADELVLRHRLHSHSAASGSSTGQSNISHYKRPAFGLGRARCNTSSSSEESMRSVPLHAREYVESLHQNQKDILLYGKNNVKVLPRDGNCRLPGYLSLHQSYDGLRLKWTPNELINNNNVGTAETGNEELPLQGNSSTVASSTLVNDKPLTETAVSRHQSKRQLFWDCAINVDMEEIVYLHCHHEVSCGGTLILVGVDGVQSPAFYFPFGGHLLAFLTCLESGLQPHSRLDPPLWIHKDTGKIFPKLKKKFSSQSSLSSISNRPVNEEMLTAADDIDYVFRIVNSYRPKLLHDLIDPKSLQLPALTILKGIRLPWRSHSRDDTVSTEHSTTATESSNDSFSDSGSADITSFPPFSPVHSKAGGTMSRPPLHTRDSLQRLCETMKTKILSRAFNGWLAHCRHLRTVREHLSGLVYSDEVIVPVPPENERCLTTDFWNSLSEQDQEARKAEIYRRIYYGGMVSELRQSVWPYLLGHYRLGSSYSERRKCDTAAQKSYEDAMSQWMAVEAVLKRRAEEKQHMQADANEDDMLAAVEDSDVIADDVVAHDYRKPPMFRRESSLSNDVFIDASSDCKDARKQKPALLKWHTVDSGYREDFCAVRMSQSFGGLINGIEPTAEKEEESTLFAEASRCREDVLEQVDLNLHRIDKDVHRCDRNYWYFTENNLKKLRNVMCTYVWKNLDVGYIQGMCDLVAPLLVIFDDESLTYSCFSNLMKRMVNNFPNGPAMDNHLANMRSLIRVLDPELFDLMQHNGDYTHFFFCYRWLLLDFKRELPYEDVFLVWETIWVAKHVCSDNYVAFIALAMIEAYRDIIIDNSMDFIDIMKFFNEMAEKHEAREVLSIARELVFRLQTLMEKK